MPCLDNALLACLFVCVQAVVDNEQIIGLELSSLMAITDAELTDVVKSYYDGFKVSIVCSPEKYTEIITAMCSQFKAGPQFVTTAKGEKVRIDIKAAWNSYDKAKHGAEDVEGTAYL